MRRSQRLQSVRLFAVAAWFVGFGALAPPASAAEAEPPNFTAGTGECPSPKAVRLAVLALIPRERQQLLADRVRVELVDLGESYRVQVRKPGAVVDKTYFDPARDCDGRVRFAAVFAVLTLMPPELGEEEPSPPQEVAPAPPPEPAPAPRPRTRIVTKHEPLAHIELGFLYAAAPPILEAPSLHTLGGELRVALGRGALAGTLSIAYMRPAKFEIAEVEGELSQLPVSAGLRFTSTTRSLSITGDLALLAVAQRVRAKNLLRSDTHGSLEAGFRAGFSVSPSLTPALSPFLGAFAWVSPAPRKLAAVPVGDLGNLPYLWLGVAAGLSLGL